MQDLDQIAEQAPPLMSKTVYLLEQLKAAGEPITISINGRTGIVVDDEKSIDHLIALVDRLETIKIVRDRLKDYDEGRRGLSLDEMKEQVRSKYGFSH